MQISYLGNYSFKLKDKNASLITDPSGIAKTEADIVTISEPSPEHGDLSRLKNEPFVIDGPGEYEVKGISVFALAVEEKVIYTIEIESVRVVFLGVCTRLDEKVLEELDGVDVLLVKAAKDSVKLVSKIEPAIVIPMAYSESELQEFLKEYGSEGEKMEKLVVSKSALTEETKLVILNK